MKRGSRELWYALLAITLITLGYALFALPPRAVPAPASLSGHMLGVTGFILMLMTETLYSLRKRNRRAAHWGRADSWLRFHIFTGIVGPYMVLLHTAWQFNGLAGAVTLLMVVIVGSGFIGRYIYTLVPRTAAGAELGGRDLESYIATASGAEPAPGIPRYRISAWVVSWLFPLPQTLSALAWHPAWYSLKKIISILCLR